MNCIECNDPVNDGVECSACHGVLHFGNSCSGLAESTYRRMGANRSTWRCAQCRNASYTSNSTGTQPQQGIAEVLQEIKLFRADFGTVQSDIANLKSNIETCTSTVRDLDTKCCKMESRFTAIEDRLIAVENNFDPINVEIKNTSSIAQSLSTRVSTLENAPNSTENYFLIKNELTDLKKVLEAKDQWSRMNNIEIKGIPAKKNENLVSLVCEIGKIINYPVTNEHINFLSRVRSSAKVKPIIVCFTSRQVKENYLASAKRQKNLRTSDLGFSETSDRIYVNDHLTRANKQLLTKTKELTASKGYQFTWVKHCKIQVRKNEISPIIVIQTDDDLNKIM
ncbi:hypothetical protein O0L34_g3054 [Tuta absoluta]|nr:hypothetical protein O0L34_g3054 [Tuta absoluta]